MWEPRRVITLGQARRHSGLVVVLRLAFTIGAAVSAGSLFGPLISHAIASFNQVAPPPAAGVTMINPRFNGRDANDQPFVITAATAKQRRGEKQVVDLDSPVLEDGLGTVVSAASGVYNRPDQALELTGDVELLDVNGYKFSTEAATMHVQENRIEGGAPLKGSGPLGEVRADSYEVVDNGNRIILRGNVWTRIVPEESTVHTADNVENSGVEENSGD